MQLESTLIHGVGRVIQGAGFDKTSQDRCLSMEDRIKVPSSVEYVGGHKPSGIGIRYDKLKALPKKSAALR